MFLLSKLKDFFNLSLAIMLSDSTVCWQTNSMTERLAD